MPSCETYRERLMAHADGELGAAERVAVEEHARGCAACAAALRHETAMSQFLRTRLPVRDAAPTSLRDAIRTRASALPSSPAPWYVRGLAWRWTPRLAMAAVLAVLLVVPLQYFRRGVPGIVTVAVARHACHALEPSGDLPPCCIDLRSAPGDALGPPSAGASVPDLEPAGLRFMRAARCTFQDRPVNLIAYRDARNRPFSVYITDADREFKLLRTRRVDGTTRFQLSVPPEAGGGEAHEVVLFEQSGFVYTLVGPDAGAEFEAALRGIQDR